MENRLLLIDVEKELAKIEKNIRNIIDNNVYRLLSASDEDIKKFVHTSYEKRQKEYWKKE